MSNNSSSKKVLFIEKNSPLDYVHSIIRKNDVMGNRGLELVELSRIYAQQGMHEKALDILSEAIDAAKNVKSEKSEPERRVFKRFASIDILIKSAEAYYQMGRGEQASRILLKTINETFAIADKYPHFATDYLSSIARLFYGNDEKGKALDVLNDISRKIINGCFLSKNIESLQTLIRAEAKTFGETKNPNIVVVNGIINKYMTICQRLIKTFCDIGLPDKATSLVDNFFWHTIWVEFRHDFLESMADAFAYVAVAYAEKGGMEEACKILRRGDPNSTRIGYIWSIAYAKCGDWENAFRATPNKNDNIALLNGVYLDIAELAIIKSKKIIAKKALDLAVKCAENHGIPYFTLRTMNKAAKLTLLMGDSKKNAVICNKALQYAIDHHDVLWETVYDDNLIDLVANCVKTGKEQEAVKLLRKVLMHVVAKEDAFLKSASALCVAKAYLNNGMEIAGAEAKLFKEIDA